MMRWVAILLLFIFPLLSFSQKGIVEGTVKDASSGKALSATITIAENQKSFATDAEGNFTLSLTEGKKYIVKISCTGYVTKVVEDVEASSKYLNVVLTPSVKTEAAVEVRSSAKKETTAALIALQKNTPVVAQVISAEAIRRSPDKNTGEVLKRVTGTSVQEGKYLVVRGLNDRYNQAMLNGILLSSTEPDRKTFSFDIFPAAVIDNIVMNKTFLPELPGEWAGGLVQVQTKDVPSQTFLNVQAGSGFNTNNVSRPFMQARSGSFDFLGIDDGSRALPDNFPLKSAFSKLSPDEKTNFGRQLKNNWQPISTAAPVNSSFQLNGGGVIKIAGKKVAGILSLTYSQANRRMPFENRFIANNEGDVELLYQNEKYSRDVLAGGMANVAVVLNNNNKITVRSLLNVNTSDFVINRFDGRDFILSGGGAGDKIKATETGFRQNTFFNTQLTGEHTVNKWDAKLKWYGGFTILDQYIPDQRRLFYTQSADDTTGTYFALLGLGAGQKSGSIFYSFLNDYIYTAGGDLSKTFKWKGKQQTIKAGYLLQVKDRLFDSRPFFINTASNSLKVLAAEQLFNPSNFGSGNDKLQFDEISGNSFRYVANTILNAAYLQMDNIIGDKFRFVWGVRFEGFDQVVGSLIAKDPRHVHSVVNDFLPGFNLTYKLNNTTNIRLAGSQTVIRPEFRELSPFAFYDFELGAQVVGNKGASRTKVSNFDLRFEKYPRPGELFTVGIFGKYFDKPIEYYFNRTGPGTNTFNILNTQNAKAIGIEVEARKKLDFIPSLKNFTVSGNISYIYSHVSDSTNTINRPMQGQSPYLINLGLQYDAPKSGFTSTVLFNQIGRRILFVGNEAISDIWEAPRPLVDIQIAQKVFHRKGEFKLNISDLLNRPANFYHDLDGNGKYKQGSRDVLAITRRYGTTVSVSFSYNIK